MKAESALFKMKQMQGEFKTDESEINLILQDLQKSETLSWFNCDELLAAMMKSISEDSRS